MDQEPTKSAGVPQPIKAYILKRMLSPEKVSTTSIYKYNPDDERNE